jgi:hypothetical protein
MDINALCNNKYYLNITYVITAIVVVTAIVFTGNRSTYPMYQFRQPAHFVTLTVGKY